MGLYTQPREKGRGSGEAWGEGGGTGLVPRGPAVQVGCAREGGSCAQPAGQPRPRKAGSTRVLLLQVGKTTVQVIRLKLKIIKIQNKKGRPRLKPARPWRWGRGRVVLRGGGRGGPRGSSSLKGGVQGGGDGAERGRGDSGGSRAAACPLSVFSLSDGDTVSSRGLLHCLEEAWGRGWAGAAGEVGAGHRLVLASSRIFQITRCMQALASSLELCPSTLSWMICLR